VAGYAPGTSNDHSDIDHRARGVVDKDRVVSFGRVLEEDLLLRVRRVCGLSAIAQPAERRGGGALRG
jgi:hypothetical protein